MDIVTPEVRSRMMRGIRGKNTGPERSVRSAAHRLGLRFRLHVRELPGRPDLVFPRHKTVIFVHGCFWHAHQGCKYAKTPSTRTEFWTAKLQGNIERDRRATDKLAEMGWRVLNVWECSTRDPEAAAGLSEALRRWIDSDAQIGEISAKIVAAARQS